jgi:D-alanyl-lipoteichoic acid acyltransferase DltB (MBOAT superfamily)
MLFNSFEFIFVFLPITFIVYFLLNKNKLVFFSKAWILLASLFFYGYWNIVYLPIIILSLLFNFYIGQLLSKEKIAFLSKKQLLFLGITANIALLGYFKYADFFIDNYNLFFDSDVSNINILLPLAISFFTFQQIAYLVDSYKQETREQDIISYAVFVTFFPQLIAGPIVHHREMMPQFDSKKEKFIKHRNIILGLFIFSIGLFKKVVLADTFSIWANAGFDINQSLSFFEAWATSLSYTFQLYFDFSGYADMAIGSALLFNIKIPINFNSPYKAKNIQDFWRRWHMTLSRFLMDYIYIPLGGNRFGGFVTYRNILITFIIAGIWHGAGWTFIFWGVLHGVALILYKLWSITNIRLWGWVSWFVTFNFINVSWVFFRAREWNDAIRVVSGMFSVDNVSIASSLEKSLSFLADFGVKFEGVFAYTSVKSDVYAWIVLGFVLVLLFKNSVEMTEKFKTNKIYLFLHMAIMYKAVTSINTVSEFLYFNF